MHWQSATDFFAMGGRGAFVWGAYGVMAVLLAVEPLLAWRRHRAAKTAIAVRAVADAALRKAAGARR
jgi:heme exporter protein D